MLAKTKNSLRTHEKGDEKKVLHIPMVEWSIFIREKKEKRLISPKNIMFSRNIKVL